MKIAIVEDDLSQRTKLRQLIENFATTNDLSITISEFEDGLTIVDQFHNDFDVIYFDIQMPLLDGMSAAKKIRQQDPNVLIVFLTNYVQFAIEGYAVNASDFLLKPLTGFSFQAHFKKLVQQLQQQQPQTYVIKNKTGWRKIALDDLSYVESEGHALYFHVHDDVYSTLGALKNLETELAESHFFRCNNCYLVNMKHVQGIDGHTLHLGQSDLTISRPRKKAFMVALTNYLADGGQS
ncbi:response regulator protein [Agrilactobacillus composti DSM 18527 = JCM 14202]|uniref:Response regulator protein n=1 Tax=Agrilactobacillus composti DSM 18527 = JCM 14202 TaxID=1423734 RepID=X0QQV5_9LACO|nr:LytTR family DNA-binding domain-containing protein [Agrilactobacillus composti]KRM35453.1 response regulator protein [Agrilactobacillus composti DSM 18527 = JCM 14202]GAF40975.1 two-component response regulator [Agrilactobacillus composti DSM 18527 = JCM 14202]